MKDKIENMAAATLAAAVVLSPTLLIFYTLEYFIKLIFLL